jgi:hypothetical protein
MRRTVVTRMMLSRHTSRCKSWESHIRQTTDRGGTVRVKDGWGKGRMGKDDRERTDREDDSLRKGQIGRGEIGKRSAWEEDRSVRNERCKSRKHGKMLNHSASALLNLGKWRKIVDMLEIAAVLEVMEMIDVLEIVRILEISLMLKVLKVLKVLEIAESLGSRDAGWPGDVDSCDAEGSRVRQIADEFNIAEELDVAEKMERVEIAGWWTGGLVDWLRWPR